MSDFKVLILFLYCVEFLPSLSRCLSIVSACFRGTFLLQTFEKTPHFTCG